jgi:peptide/nickel transport system substrate-binding protein
MKNSRIFVLFILTIAFVCCSNTGSVKDSVVVLAVDSLPQSLDPRIGTDVTSQKIHQLIYSGLVKKNRDGNIVPDLISDYSFKDSLTLSITIKEGMKFHDGSILTAHDVKYTYDSLLDKDFMSMRKNSYSSVKTIEVLDDTHIVFKLTRMDASLFNNLVIGILPTSTNQTQILNNQIIGSGPFQFIDFKDNTIRLSPFKLNNENKNNFKELNIRIIPDAVTRALEIQNRSVDIAINNIPFDNLKVLEKRKNLRLYNSPGSRYSYLACNLNDKFLKFPRVREAICLAINRDKIIKYLYAGFAGKAESVLPIRNAYFLKMRSREYNPELSKKLLRKFGITPQDRITLELKVSNTGIGKKLGLVLAEELRVIGIELQVSVREFSAFYNDIKKGNFQLYALAWVGISDPDIFYYIFHSTMTPPRGANRGFFKSARLDFLSERARGIYDFERRQEIYSEIQRILYRELPYISLWYEDNLAVINRKVRGFELYAFGDFYPLKDIQLESEEGRK